mmetsp:Transcript_50549/g.98849  ORF Transcript_50549/g.98849 Transcript_50549/m.98849 type:complete len:421 (+) Transcript_50549:1432-2694(+)
MFREAARVVVVLEHSHQIIAEGEGNVRLRVSRSSLGFLVSGRVSLLERLRCSFFFHLVVTVVRVAVATAVVLFFHILLHILGLFLTNIPQKRRENLPIYLRPHGGRRPDPRGHVPQHFRGSLRRRLGRSRIQPLDGPTRLGQAPETLRHLRKEIHQRLLVETLLVLFHAPAPQEHQRQGQLQDGGRVLRALLPRRARPQHPQHVPRRRGQRLPDHRRPAALQQRPESVHLREPTERRRVKGARGTSAPAGDTEGREEGEQAGRGRRAKTRGGGTGVRAEDSGDAEHVRLCLVRFFRRSLFFLFLFGGGCFRHSRVVIFHVLDFEECDGRQAVEGRLACSLVLVVPPRERSAGVQALDSSAGGNIVFLVRARCHVEEPRNEPGPLLFVQTRLEGAHGGQRRSFPVGGAVGGCHGAQRRHCT